MISLTVKPRFIPPLRFFLFFDPPFKSLLLLTTTKLIDIYKSSSMVFVNFINSSVFFINSFIPPFCFLLEGRKLYIILSINKIDKDNIIAKDSL